MSEDNCKVCREPVINAHVECGQLKFHTDCFRCYHCLRLFPENVFFETETAFYCQDDYNLLVLARCQKCAEVIQGKCVSALDAKWHIEHFCCENCGRSLVGASFQRKDDKPYCKLCPTDKEKAKIKLDEVNICDHCKKPIERHPLFFKGKKVHPTHFYCFACQKQLDHTAREFDGELYCFADYERIQSKVCNACRKPIVTTSVSAMGKVFHPEHFVCFKCENPFNGAAFFEYENQPYCEKHYKLVNGDICGYCRKTVVGNPIEAVDNKWCSNHFHCHGCFVSLSDLKRVQFQGFDGKPMCKRCFEKVPSEVKRAVAKYLEKEKQFA